MRDPDLGTTDEERTRNLLRVLQGMRGSRCAKCAGFLCPHEAVMSVVMGFQDAPHCWDCLSLSLGRDPVELRDHIYEYIRYRPCFFSGWRLASQEEGYGNATLPRCLWPESAPGGRVEAAPVAPIEKQPWPAESGAPPPADAEWNAGEMSCGDLVLELRLRLMVLQPHQVLQVTALDPAAPEDMPAWCRLTGHTLLYHVHPQYWIRRKEK